MDLRNLYTFIQVAELNSFTKAGEKLGYSQPTISLQIKQLEKELNTQLFERIGHTVTLTDNGREVLSYAQRICQMSEEMVTDTSRQKEPSGIVRIAMADSLTAPLITQAFHSFQHKYPHISLHIITSGTDEMFRLLDHNEADIVCTLDSHNYSLNYVIANEEKVGVHFVCAFDNPLASLKKVTLTDILSQPFILTEKGMSYRRLLDEQLSKYSLEVQPILELGRADLICQLVSENIGISFLPDLVTRSAVDTGKITRLHVPEIQVELWKQLLYHRDKWMSAHIAAVLNHLKEIRLN